MTPLALVFPDRGTALQLAMFLAGWTPEEMASEPLTSFPTDGWLASPDGHRRYYNICEVGVIKGYSGHCLIGMWHGPPETVPAPLLPFCVDAEAFPARYG